MKKIILVISIIFLYFTSVSAEIKIKPLKEGNVDARVNIIVYESLTCGHCADFHKEVYPKLKKDFIDNGLVKIEFRSFPLDLGSFNASKIAHCKNDGKPDILHFLYDKQQIWIKGETIEQINLNLKTIINRVNFGIDFNQCINDEKVENHILEDRIESVKKFEINSTPTLIINNKKFKKPLTYKNLKKAIEKLI